ncbi:MAG TPA: hypothetical protein VHE30_21660 [Polyangiaceae bacterium]|nr:hypothetical protein [Polyangiaceae bacterium]
MAKAREFPSRATRVALAAGAVMALASGTAGAEGVSFGLSGSTSGPGGDSAKPAEPAPAEASSPPPQADAPAAAISAPAEYDRNPANYEFGFVTAAAYQAWNLSGKSIYFGLGGGLGPPLYRYTHLSTTKEFAWDPTLEIAYANAFIRFTAGFVDLDIGPKIGLGTVLYNPKSYSITDPPRDPTKPSLDDAPMSFFQYGAYADLRFGSRGLKVGPRIEIDRVALAGFYDTAIRITPLMLRWMH